MAGVQVALCMSPGFLQVVHHSEGQPKFGRCAEPLAEQNRGLGGDPPPSVSDGVGEVGSGSAGP